MANGLNGHGHQADCKGWQHWWARAPWPPYENRKAERGAIKLYWICDKGCGNAKITTINLATGQTVRTLYRHPDTWHEVTMTRGEWKLEYIRQKRIKG